jgi:hypothetical protein
MPRANKKLAALAALFSLEFLSVGLFTNGTFPWSYQYIQPLLKASSPTDVRTVKLTAKTSGGLVLERYGESTSRIFFADKEIGPISTRSFVAGALFPRVILASKVPRYLSKSVLNL